MGASRPPRSTSPQGIRGLSTDEGIRIARGEPHLIKSGKASEGYYVGGPPNVKSYEDLQAYRRNLDRYIEAGAEGADWFRRTRDDINEVTGGNPVANNWISHQHAMWSGRVSPDTELGFALKENNSAIAGDPRRAFLPWQHEAQMRAVENNDTRYYRLGEKTGQYQKKIEPRRPGSNVDPHDTATGVNDFRYASVHGYPEPYRLDRSQHEFMDHETALAVDRARRRNLAGRSNWTGEEVQAAAWLAHRTEAILQKQPEIIGDRVTAAERRAAAEGLSSAERHVLIEQAKADAHAEAFSMANRTIGNFFDKHTAHEIYPLVPDEGLRGHMPGLAPASRELKTAYAADPRSTWATESGKRDGVYANTGIADTGVTMRVRPTNAIPEEFTEVARPLVAFRTKGGNKVMSRPDRMLLDTGSFTRGAIDALPEVRVIKTWDGGDVANTNAVRFDFDRPLTQSQRLQLSERLEAHGLPEVVDTGQGVVAANFAGGPIDIDKLRAVQKTIQEILPDANPIRTYAEQVRHDLASLFAKGEGSGAVTEELLRKLDSNPAMREAFNQNVNIPLAARERAARDEQWAGKVGAPRNDIQNLRHLIGKGPGWIDRLDEAHRTGSISLPSHVPAPFSPSVRLDLPARGGGGGISYMPIQVDDLPKMNDARMAQQARELIAQSTLARVERQRQEWLRTNALKEEPPRPRIPKYDPIY